MLLVKFQVSAAVEGGPDHHVGAPAQVHRHLLRWEAHVALGSQKLDLHLIVEESSPPRAVDVDKRALTTPLVLRRNALLDLLELFVDLGLAHAYDLHHIDRYRTHHAQSLHVLLVRRNVAAFALEKDHNDFFVVEVPLWNLESLRRLRTAAQNHFNK